MLKPVGLGMCSGSVLCINIVPRICYELLFLLCLVSRERLNGKLKDR